MPPEPAAARSSAAAPSAAVAAFDFDGTLARRGSVWPFLLAECGLLPLLRAALPLLPRLVLAGLLGGHHADGAKEALFTRTLAGRPAAAVAERARSFGSAHLHRRVRVDVRDRLLAHRAAGHAVAIVSASPECYLWPVAEELGADTVIATALQVDGAGRLTGRYEGGNCRGPAKLRRVRQWAAAVAGPSPVLWAYGNSAGDRELLAGADVPVNVGRLGRMGRLRRFPPLRHAPAPLGAASPSGSRHHRPPTAAHEG